MSSTLHSRLSWRNRGRENLTDNAELDGNLVVERNTTGLERETLYAKRLRRLLPPIKPRTPLAELDVGTKRTATPAIDGADVGGQPLVVLSMSEELESAAAAARPPSENLVNILLEHVRKLQSENQRLAEEKASVERKLYNYEYVRFSKSF